MDNDKLDEHLITPLRTGVPRNTQLTERAAKLTTEAAAAVSGEERQDCCAVHKLAFGRPVPWTNDHGNIQLAEGVAVREILVAFCLIFR